MKQVLIKPLITEKTNKLMENLNKYGFVVDGEANKVEIRNAVEDMYGVVVRDVRTMNMPAKISTKFTKSGVVRGRKSGFKKAVITLDAGEEIDFYKEV